MAYSTNPNLPRARATAMKLLLIEELPVQTVANKCGIHRSTVWRWHKKWLEVNQHRQMDNANRPTRPVGRSKLETCRWLVPTNSSRPHSSPHAICDEIVGRILQLRRMLNRCAEVIWHHAVHKDGIGISLSSVRRILKRHHCFDGARKPRVRPNNPKRPVATKAGELLQADTIHYVCPHTKQRRYVYTVIDLYTRMAYAETHRHIRPGLAANVILRAQAQWGFNCHMVQTDHGPEFGRYFTQSLAQHRITVRHSRLGRPNDNAHIERFNRTVQDECLGRYISNKTSSKAIQDKLARYIAFYNHERVHLNLQCQTPTEMLQRS